jgi:hypothetical protein
LLELRIANRFFDEPMAFVTSLIAEYSLSINLRRRPQAA